MEYLDTVLKNLEDANWSKEYTKSVVTDLVTKIEEYKRNSLSNFAKLAIDEGISLLTELKRSF